MIAAVACRAAAIDTAHIGTDIHDIADPQDRGTSDILGALGIAVAIGWYLVVYLVVVRKPISEQDLMADRPYNIAQERNAT